MDRSKIFFHAFVIGIICFSLGLSSNNRDKFHQPEKVMDVAGVKPGMILGEVGSGNGYFTFKLARRVGKSGHVYANDISRSSLRSLKNRCDREGVTNIDTIVGEVEDWTWCSLSMPFMIWTIPLLSSIILPQASSRRHRL